MSTIFDFSARPLRQPGYCHITRSSLDSCRCDDLDDAEAAADCLVSRAKQLYDCTEVARWAIKFGVLLGLGRTLGRWAFRRDLSASLARRSGQSNV